MKNYQEMHNKRMEAIKEKLLGSSIADTINVKGISNTRIERIKEEINKVIAPHQVRDQFSYRTGNVIGIIRSVVFHRADLPKLLQITGLTEDLVNLYMPIIGNNPYIAVNKKTGEKYIEYGHPIKADEAREYITLCAMHMDVVVEDSDLFDITQERCDAIYANELEKVEDSFRHEVKEENLIQYEE